jgi:hypothetical protein
MAKYLKEYIRLLESIDKFDSEDKKIELLDELVLKIGFFSHERLIHLIVTVTFAILTLLSLILCYINSSLSSYALLILFLILLVPYIWHYYVLENGVQKLYKEYDRIGKL